jgi:hypothetical protein
MSQDVSFRRKVIYTVVIVLLLFPLFWIGQPATLENEGGILARLRAENDLSQAELGEIDPASESMKLATLGLRGVAANVLWEKAIDYKKKEDWDSVSATLNQISKLQPNFITVWEHQSHNLSYNISVEFDDYRHRYHWVKKGISFLIDGVHYNRDNPRLLHYAGWITGQKMGRADEHVQFREMFREDNDFHDELNQEITVENAAGYDGRPDSWLAGREWYLRAERAVDQKGKPLRGKSPLIFHKDAPMSLIDYAATIEEEGILGELAQRAWSQAETAWAKFGQRPIPTSWGHNVLLGDYQKVNDELLRMRERLEELAPGVRERLRQEKIEKLTPEQRAALQAAAVTEENYEDYFKAIELTEVSNEEVGREAPEEDREKAVKLAAQLTERELLSKRISHYRSTINYDYWEIRCAAEKTKTAVDAREYIYEAKKYYDAADLENARAAYEKAWGQWREIFDQYPRLMDDVAADDLERSVLRYDRLLQQLDEEIPADFPLVDFLRLRREKDEGIERLYKKLEAMSSSTGEASSTEKDSEDQPAEPPASREEPGAGDSRDAATEPPASDDADAAPVSDEQPSEKSESAKPASSN